jgi:hypothetical protein
MFRSQIFTIQNVWCKLVHAKSLQVLFSWVPNFLGSSKQDRFAPIYCLIWLIQWPPCTLLHAAWPALWLLKLWNVQFIWNIFEMEIIIKNVLKHAVIIVQVLKQAAQYYKSSTTLNENYRCWSTHICHVLFNKPSTIDSRNAFICAHSSLLGVGIHGGW